MRIPESKQAEVRDGYATEQQVAEILVRKNPFYLISAAFVIHGASYWFKASGGHDPWKLMGLLGVFIVLLAVIGVAIARFGKVWDDARSVLIILMLLFVELAMSFDETLVVDSMRAIPILIFGWLFSVATFEGVLAALRISVRKLFRIPFHAMLVLLFLYPLSMIPAIRHSAHATISWQLLAFSFCVAGSVLMLLPAVRQGVAYAAESGTPWKWPWFPWAPLAVMVVGLVIRGYAMCVSLDPAISQSVGAARQLNSIFASYFLVPIVLAIAVLLLETGLTLRILRIQRLALCVPLLAIFLSLKPWFASSLQQNFLFELTVQFGSPLFHTLCASFVFYMFAAFRSVIPAGWWLTASAVGFVFAGPSTVMFELQPRLIPLLLIAATHFMCAICWRNVAHLVVGALAAIPIVHGGIAAIAGEWCVPIEMHALLAACLLAGVYWRHSVPLGAASILIAAFALMATLPNGTPLAEFSAELRFVYVAALVSIAVALMSLFRLWALLPGAVISGLCLLIVVARIAWLTLRDVRGWQGLLFYLAGLVCLLIAVGISRLKFVTDAKAGAMRNS